MLRSFFLVQNILFATFFDNYNICYSCIICYQMILDNKISTNKIIFTRIVTFFFGRNIVFIVYMKLSLSRDCLLWKLLMWKRRRLSVCLSVFSFMVTDHTVNERFLVARINFVFLCPGKLNWTPKESYRDGVRHHEEIQFKLSWRISTIPYNLFP